MAANIKKKRDSILEDIKSYDDTYDTIRSLPDGDIEKLYGYVTTGILPDLDSSSTGLIYGCVNCHNSDTPTRKRLLEGLIKREYPAAYSTLATLYEVEGNSQKAWEYYPKGADLGDINCQIQLAHRNKSRGNFEEAEKLFEIITDHVSTCEMCREIYKKNPLKAKLKLVHLMKEGIFMAWKTLLDIYYVEKAKLDSIFLEFLMYKPNWEYLPPAFMIIAKLYKTGIEFIDLHFKYSPGEKGADECKKDFADRLLKK